MRKNKQGFVDKKTLRLYTIGGLDWWTGLVDWTTGLTNFRIKHTGMLSKLPQELIVSNITLVLDLVFYVWRFRLGCDDLYHIFYFSLGYMEHAHVLHFMCRP